MIKEIEMRCIAHFGCHRNDIVDFSGCLVLHTTLCDIDVMNLTGLQSCKGGVHETCNAVFALFRFCYEEPNCDFPLHEVSARGCLPGTCGHITHSPEECELSPIPM